MRIKLAAVGRMRSGAEAGLVNDYLSRAEKAGRSIGVGPISLHEVEARKGGTEAEADLLSKAVGTANPVVVLDERGRTMTSPALAAQIAAWRDHGNSDLAFVIGGADGTASALRDRADLVLSFGKMVWPHMLARVMLAEQIYRSVSILTNSPYHRE